MNREFNILDRHENIHRHCLLEASAGTGKTFTVENLVVRFLLEKGPHHNALQLDQILVVTFTKAATRDLKRRIRYKILETIHLLKNDIPSENVPDYIKSLREKKDSLKSSIQALERALFGFDQAQIFTIHGFCHRILSEYLFESGISLQHREKESIISAEKMLQIIQDFLRTEIRSSIFSPLQFSRLAITQESVEQLKKNLLTEILMGGQRAPLRDFADQLNEFKASIKALQELGFHDSAKIIADFEAQAPFYKGICDKQGNIKPDNLAKIVRFAKLFDKKSVDSSDFDSLIEDGLYLLEAIDPANYKVKKNPDTKSLNYPSFISELQKDLASLIKEARDVNILFMRLTYHAQKYLQTYFEKEEIRNFDSLLTDMQKAASNTVFANLVKQKYKAAIIDEFQDTDPIQWNIFERLFLHPTVEGGYLYLIGDPKQSIYAFRQADIYTYIRAGHALGTDLSASLKTNYRSQPKLINALNFLFSSCSQFIRLPRLKTHLEYQQVKSSDKNHIKNFQDHKGSLHFFSIQLENKLSAKQLELAERDYFFPFIIQEIIQLHLQEIEFHKIAILVADRYQCDRLSEALKEKKIPCLMQHSQRLIDSQAIHALRELLSAVLNPKNESAVKLALGGPIIGWEVDQIYLLNTSDLYEKIALIFFDLHTTLMDKGLAAFINDFMSQVFPPYDISIAEKILSREEGEVFYQVLMQLAEILIEFQSNNQASPEIIFNYLTIFYSTQKNEDRSIKQRPNTDLQGVNILTTHSSKGLEYDIVFALGLVKRTSKSPEKRRLDTSHYPPLIVPILDENSREYLQVCEEVDAEKMRLLYVALTRAKQRVYVPALFSLSETSQNLGMSSPIELFLAGLEKKSLHYIELYERVQNLTYENLEKLIEDASRKNIDITLSDLTKVTNNASTYSSASSPILLPPIEFTPHTKMESMYSYSSLIKSLKQEKKVDVVDFKPPHDWNVPLKNPHTLPSGAEIGTLLHKILELAPLGKLDSKEIKKIITLEVSGNEWEPWREVIENMILNALTCTFPIEETPFSLSDIDPRKVYREMEFLFPWSEDLKIEGCQISGGFLKGFIDLVFEHRGKYYILDWKSNWLGPSPEFYSRNYLEKAIHSHHYFLQAAIYQKALKQYLQMVESSLFDNIFGGVIYLFLRGISDIPSLTEDRFMGIIKVI